MAKAFFYHNHPADTAIIIFKRVDLLKADVEIQNCIHIYRLILIRLDQLVQLATYRLSRHT